MTVIDQKTDINLVLSEKKIAIFTFSILFCNARTYLLLSFFFQRLWPALNYGLESYLKAQYTKESMTAWKRVFYYIVKQMKLGMASTAPEVDDEVPLTPE